MSALELVNPVYTQIENNSVMYANQTIKGIEDQIDGSSPTVAKCLGSVNRHIHYGFNTNVVLSVSSTIGDDSYPSVNIGAKTILVKGLFCDTSDNNRYKPREATFNLWGTTPINTAHTGTNLFAVVNSIDVITVGDNNTNFGLIDVVADGTTDLYGCIQIGHSKSNVLSFGTGYNQQHLLKEIHLSSSCHTASVLELYEQNLNTGLKILISKIQLNSNSTHIEQQINHKIPKIGAYVFFGILSNLEPVLSGDTNHICCNITSLVA